jgi:hypothetical protein
MSGHSGENQVGNICSKNFQGNASPLWSWVEEETGHRPNNLVSFFFFSNSARKEFTYCSYLHPRAVSPGGKRNEVVDKGGISTLSFFGKFFSIWKLLKIQMSPKRPLSVTCPEIVFTEVEKVGMLQSAWEWKGWNHSHCPRTFTSLS